MVLGFNTYVTAQTISEQKRLGARTSRLFVPWAGVEAIPGDWDWQQSDQQYAQLVGAGLRPLIVAVGSPCWARPGMGCNDLLFTGPPRPSFDGAWTQYVRELALRYPAAIGIEIWNEPNLVSMFWPRVDPVRYTQLLREAYRAIKAVDPRMPVVSGGLIASAISGWSPAGEGDGPFLAGMYDAGAGSVMNAIGAHPYPAVVNSAGRPVAWRAAAMEQSLQRLRAARRAAHAHQPIWITEVGESTTTEHGFPPAVSASRQARDLATMITEARADGDVRVMIIHTLEDEAPDLILNLVGQLSGQLFGDDVFFDAVQAGFGIFTSSWAPKPAACVVSRLLHGSLVC